MKKFVTFSNNNNISYIPNRYTYNPGMLRYLISGKIYLNDRANIKIMLLLNKLSKHKILILARSFKYIFPDIKYLNIPGL
jgi:hypothetical protein